MSVMTSNTYFIFMIWRLRGFCRWTERAIQKLSDNSWILCRPALVQEISHHILGETVTIKCWSYVEKLIQVDSGLSIFNKSNKANLTYVSNKEELGQQLGMESK